MVTNILCHTYYVTGTCSYHVTSFRVFTGSTRVISDQRGKSDISVGRFNASHWLEITIHMVFVYYYYKITDHVIILDGVIIASYDTTKESWRVFIRNWPMEGGLTIPTSWFLSRGVYSFRFAQLRPNRHVFLSRHIISGVYRKYSRDLGSTGKVAY